MFRKEVVKMPRKVGVCLSLLLFFVLSCGKVIDKGNFQLSKNSSYVILPFINYTDTPLAGYRVASIFGGLLKAKGFKVNDNPLLKNGDIYSLDKISKKDIDKYIQKYKFKARYIITGTVNEFSYKMGLDNEPAVSITIYLIDTKTGRVINAATLSADGSPYDSLSTLTQYLLRKVVTNG